MRVVLVGRPEERARLRTGLPIALQVVGEAATIAAARGAAVQADALVLAPQGGTQSVDEAPIETLTAREREVLTLLADGLSNKVIAGRLGISDQTVKFHVAAVCGKLSVANRTEAVRQAIRRGLIPL